MCIRDRATIISQFISFCLLFNGTRKGGNLRIDIRKFSPSIERYKIILNGGMPSLCRQGLGSVATTCMNLMAVSYTHLDVYKRQAMRWATPRRAKPGLKPLPTFTF